MLPMASQAPILNILAMSFLTRLPVGTQELAKAQTRDMLIIIKNWDQGNTKNSGIWMNTICCSTIVKATVVPIIIPKRLLAITSTNAS